MTTSESRPPENAGAREAAVEEGDLAEGAVQPARVGEVTGVEDDLLAAQATQLCAFETAALDTGRLERQLGEVLAEEIKLDQLDVGVLTLGTQTLGGKWGQPRRQRRHVRRRLPPGLAPLTAEGLRAQRE